MLYVMYFPFTLLSNSVLIYLRWIAYFAFLFIFLIFIIYLILPIVTEKRKYHWWLKVLYKKTTLTKLCKILTSVIQLLYKPFFFFSHFRFSPFLYESFTKSLWLMLISVFDFCPLCFWKLIFLLVLCTSYFPN